MILFPAIDLKDGECVRLLRGDMTKATVFSRDPLRQAQAFAAVGFGWLHVVDFNGAIDGRSVNEGRVAVQGWVEQSDISVSELAQRFEGAGAAAIIFTDISRDGAAAGVNIIATKALAKSVSTPVIASGGVASLDDLLAVKTLEQDGVTGVIAGRALYDGRLDAKAALKVMTE